MRRPTRFAALLAVIAAMFALVACGDGGEVEGGAELRISLTEFEFEPADLTFTTGEEVTLLVTNDGQVVHELMIGRDVMEEDGWAVGFMEDFFEGVHPSVTPPDAQAAEGHDDGGFMVVLEPGDEVRIMYTVPEGKSGQWEMACFEPGHHEAGMRGTVTVLP